MAIETIVQAIAVTAELTGAVLSTVAQAQMAKDLMAYPEADVMHALDRFRKTSKRPLTLPGVLELIDDADGRPSADEAWAMCPRDEGQSVFWTTEIQEALAIARPVLESGDKVGARMAFRDAYERLVSEARAAGIRPDWQVSLGWDADGRDQAVRKAVDRGVLSAEAAHRLLPAPKSPIGQVLIEGKSIAQVLPDFSDADREQFERGIALCKQALANTSGEQSQ